MSDTDVHVLPGIVDLRPAIIAAEKREMPRIHGEALALNELGHLAREHDLRAYKVFNVAEEMMIMEGLTAEQAMAAAETWMKLNEESET